jgi:hypothetical protein
LSGEGEECRLQSLPTTTNQGYDFIISKNTKFFVANGEFRPMGILPLELN